MAEAPKAAVEVIPKNYRKAFTICRAMGHEWQHVPELADHPTFRFIKGLQSECIGCGTVRTRWIHANGRRFGSRYEYPDRYQVNKRTDPNILRAPQVSEWRVKYVRTLGFREEDVEEDVKAALKANNKKTPTKPAKEETNGGNAPRTSVA